MVLDCCDGELEMDGKDVEPGIYGKDGKDATLLAASRISWETTADQKCDPLCIFAC